MAAKQNIIVLDEQPPSVGIPLTSLEESLFSSEKLDRASPELWPEQSWRLYFRLKTIYFQIKIMSEGEDIEVQVNVTTLTRSDVEKLDDYESTSSADFSVPGVSEFTPLPSATETTASWNKGLTKEDCLYMQQLGTLYASGLIMEVKKLHDLAYQLGLDEAKEMTRGKYLNIFSSRRNR